MQLNNSIKEIPKKSANQSEYLKSLHYLIN